MTKKSKAEQVEEKVQDAAPAAEQAEQMEGADAARQPSEEELKAMLRGENRQHDEALGDAWAVLLGQNPMWFYDPLYLRDKDDLTPGVTQTFLLSGLAIALRKALLDDVNITQGPQYEAWAAQWLAENPGKTRLDVPPLKISMTGRQLIMPGRRFAEYQVRTKVERVDDVKLEKMDIKVLYVRFPFDQRPDMVLPIYASKMVLRDYEPQEGDEVDAYVWLQGRVIDMDESPAQ